jgi:eukaryotic-like serine/threonine-protein kinase
VEPLRFGSYVLTARLGRGGMADVFRARREGAAGFERIVVVKKILATHNEDPQFVDMFINEAKIAAQLTHPNIAQVFELGSHEGELFMVLEYVKGKDLLALLKHLAKTRPDAPHLPPNAAAYVMREVCRGLAHAHEHTDDKGALRPFVHRDVSPQNIMLSYDGVVKLVDFGIAKALDSLKESTHTGSLKGKFAYMAPEQVGGKSPVPQSDIFSAGVVLHEMLTGKRLFKGNSDYETLQKVQSMPVPPPSTLVGGISAELDAIVVQALERDLSQRYARAAHMARDLDIFLSSQRFSVEDFGEYLAQVFPLDSRDDLPAHSTASYQVADALKINEATAASSPKAIAEVSERRKKPSRALLYGGGAAALVVLGAAIAYPLMRHSSPVAPRLVENLPPPKVIVPPPPHLEPRSEPMPPIDVQLTSEPAGAEVYAGPKRLGTSPLTLHLPPGGATQVTLSHPGFDDLAYNVQPSDAPSLTLRLSRKKPPPHHVVVAPPPTGKKKPRVENVDEKGTHMPHVDPIDD